ncbi:hypothetical protein OQA88_3369 [Cercophora sp. LCS_1]
MSKPPLHTLLSTHDFHALPLPPKARAFITSAAADSKTHRANNETYALIALRPRILRNVSDPVSLATSLFSHAVSSPIFAAPTSLGKLIHPRGEAEIARGLAPMGIAQVVSTSASCHISEIIAAGRDTAEGLTAGPVFFQLYVHRDLPKTEALLREVARLGVDVIFLTVDAPVVGKREADERTPFAPGDDISTPMVPLDDAVPATRPDGRGKGIASRMGAYISPCPTWSLIARLRAMLPPKTKLVLKGVQTLADALLALEHGLDGIVVSNHGGRSLDTSTASVLVLLELRQNCPEIFTKMDVLIDGGITRGTDVFKALCLGAKGVGIGRGTLVALGGYGSVGVARYFEILNQELAVTMQMCGLTNVGE